ncbi:hypothetical protein Tco_0260178 [Tanacetum coccineum]
MFKNSYNALVKAYNTDKDLLSSYGDVIIIPSIRDDKDKDEEPSADQTEDQRRGTGKEAESTNRTTQKERRTTNSFRSALDLNFTDLNETTHLSSLQAPNPHFDELMANPIDFSAFMINRLKIDHLTQELLTGPTYDLIKGTSYPHNLSKPLPLIPNALVDTKAVDYGQVKWIKDRIPRTTWSVVPIDYDKHAIRIIVVTSLKIMEFFGYKHLEEITVRRQDDQLYRFREGDFKRLRRQDIEDMLLLLVQGKLTNLNLDERFALNVALRMYTRRIVIQERVEDLQLAVESYQKKINLSRPDSYRSDLRKMTPYTAYHDIQGIIYQDDMDRNRLMRTDELHKFSDGTLNHVRTALNDIATGIQMEYLPKRKWSKQDKQRARVMINAIDKKLRDRRLMRSLEKFVGGIPYGGDFRLLQRTI